MPSLSRAGEVEGHRHVPLAIASMGRLARHWSNRLSWNQRHPSAHSQVTASTAVSAPASPAGSVSPDLTCGAGDPCSAPEWLCHLTQVQHSEPTSCSVAMATWQD